MKKVVLVVLSLVVVLSVFGFMKRDSITRLFMRPTSSTVTSGVSQDDITEEDFMIIKSGLATPWSIVFLPDGSMLATERSGRVQRIGENGRVFPVSGVRETSEGGLLGLALHPDFADNQKVYLYFTHERGGVLQNQVVQYTLRGDALQEARVILSNIPAADNHNGGGIAFGPDLKLYITTGDAAQPSLAQDTDSLAGKILRINDDGSVPSDNPFGTAVWSYGHRNPQGIAWDGDGQLWSVEHGPSGFSGSGQDELNLIEKGANYGWPDIVGDAAQSGMRRPIIHSGSDETWAPSGLAYLNGSLYFAGLRGQSLYQAEIQDDGGVKLRRHFSQEYGRLRAVAAHGDRIYFSTSNRDGRGSPSEGDDRIFSVSESSLLN